MTLDELETPCVIVDLDVLERNVARMAERARAAGVRLRPHVKTHKTVEIARRQVEAGAAGLTVSKASEAEPFAEAGFDDLFLAYPIVGLGKPERLLALSERVPRLAVGVDSVDGARALSTAFRGASRALDVLLKVDVGFRRVGVLPGDAPSVARQLADLPGLRVRGLFTHAGQGYRAESPEGVARAGHDEGRTLAEAAEAVRAAGVPVEEVSVGSTPTAPHAMRQRGVTECRPGNYVFHDASAVSLEVCRLEDCAMTVLATVVSVPAPDRAVLDAGSKTLTTDPLRPKPDGHGWILGRKSRLTRLSEEHGVIDTVGGERFRVGERVRVLPNHSCVVSNLHDVLLGVRGDRVVSEMRVVARGRVR